MRIETVKDFSGRAVEIGFYQSRMMQGTWLVTATIGDDLFFYDITKEKDVLRVVLEHPRTGRYVIGHSPTLAFAKRMCADYAVNHAMERVG